MRDLEEIKKDLLTMRKKDLDEGFFRGRKYEAESEHPDSVGPARTPKDRAQWLDAAEYSATIGGRAAAQVLADIEEMYEILVALGGDLL